MLKKREMRPSGKAAVSSPFPLKRSLIPPALDKGQRVPGKDQRRLLQLPDST